MKDVKTEVIAGITTFMTMAYIIFVQPQVLSAAGMDFDAVMMATILSAFIATLLMATLANYPIALAPGMGENFLFAYTVCLEMGVPWQVALGIVFISGVLFIILTLLRVREAIINAIPSSLKNAIAGGIGVFIAFIGLEWAGIIVDAPGSLVKLGDLRSPPALFFLFGFFLTAILMVKRVKGAILIGILGSALLGAITGWVKFTGFVSKPPSLAPTFLKLNILDALKFEFISITIVFFLLDLFDTVGTLIGIGEQAGFIKDGKLPRARQALLADAIGTVVGSLLGTSTVTSYIESAAGVSEGGRTGITAMTTAFLFLLASFFAPVVRAIGGGIQIGSVTYHPFTAPALVIVGVFMLKNVVRINWDDMTEAIPAFLTLLGIPLTFSIATGLSLGFISYTLIKLLSGRGKEVHPVMYVVTAIFILKFAFLG